MTNRTDCPAHTYIGGTVSTSPLIDFFLYLFADWDLLNLLELSQELILLLWSIPDTFFDPRNRRERDLKDLLFFCQTIHSWIAMRSSKKRGKSTQSFDAFFFKAFLTDVLTPNSSNKNVFVKPFIHEGFASYFYGFVQGDSKRALDTPQKSDFCRKWAFLSRSCFHYGCVWVKTHFCYYWHF